MSRDIARVEERVYDEDGLISAITTHFENGVGNEDTTLEVRVDDEVVRIAIWPDRHIDIPSKYVPSLTVALYNIGYTLGDGQYE